MVAGFSPLDTKVGHLPPWGLAMVAAFEEAPRVVQRRVRCYSRRLNVWQRRQERGLCGTTAPNEVLHLERVQLGTLRLLHGPGGGARAADLLR